MQYCIYAHKFKANHQNLSQKYSQLFNNDIENSSYLYIFDIFNQN